MDEDMVSFWMGAVLFGVAAILITCVVWSAWLQVKIDDGYFEHRDKIYTVKLYSELQTPKQDSQIK